MPIQNKIMLVTIVLSGGGGNRMDALGGRSTLAAGVRGPRREDKHYTGLTELG
jgi:hypothetical protein